MADIEVTEDRTGETMVVHLEGLTETGVAFVDAFTWDDMVVVDSGRIIIPESVLPAFVRACERKGLEVSR